MLQTARVDELERMQQIEIAAGEAFRQIGMSVVADDPPPSVDDLERYQREGRAFVATDADEMAVGYLLVDEIDGRGHIEQVSVHPAHARHGLGSALIDHAATWAVRRGIAELTLTTFEAVPWNAPYYARLGFRVIPELEWTPGIRQKMTGESARGLAAWPRVAMVRPVVTTNSCADQENFA